MGRRGKNNEDIDLVGFIKLLLLIIVIIVFSYVIQGLTYLFELINQYKLMLGIVSVLIIVGVVGLYRKNLLNSSLNKPSAPYYHENNDIVKQDIEKLLSKALEKDDYKIIIK